MPQVIQIRFEEGAKELAEHIFGPDISAQEIALAAGIWEGATIHFAVQSHRLVANVYHRFVEVQQRWFSVDANGELVVRNYALKKSNLAPPRFGIRMFRSQVQAARNLGIKRILVSAAGTPRPDDYNGYYTWARFGFDAELDEYAQEELPIHLASARSLNELMRLGGSAWWKANGWAMEMIFDLRDGSDSMRVLQTYVAELKQQGHL